MRMLLRGEANHAGNITIGSGIDDFVEYIAHEIEGNGVAAVQVEGVFAAQRFHALSQPGHGHAVGIVGTALGRNDDVMVRFDAAHGHAGLVIGVADDGFVVERSIDHAVTHKDGAKGVSICHTHSEVFFGGMFIAFKYLHAAVVEDGKNFKIGPLLVAGRQRLFALDFAVADDYALRAFVIPAVTVEIIADGKDGVVLLCDYFVTRYGRKQPAN